MAGETRDKAWPWFPVSDDQRPFGSGVVTGDAGGEVKAAVGIPEALPLGRALDRVPGRLVIFAGEAADLGLGAGLSRPIAEALPRVMSAVLGEFASRCESGVAGC